MLDPALVSALSAATFLPEPELRAALAEPDDARLLEWRLELSSREALGDALTRLAETGYAAQTLPNGDALATDPWRTTVRLTLSG